MTITNYICYTCTYTFILYTYTFDYFGFEQGLKSVIKGLLVPLKTG
jgi:hypothetical protein